jgi:hypothetical protein
MTDAVSLWTCDKGHSWLDSPDATFSKCPQCGKQGLVRRGS